MPKILVGIIAICVAVAGVLLINSQSKDNPTESDKNNTAEVSLQDAHGIAVDRQNSSKLYIATHNGLLSMDSSGGLQNVGTLKDDYMGFSAHPTEPNTFYTSGHPRTGGNIGFQKTTDGGQTWEKISDGANGPVDFHAMAVGQSDPSIIYGTYRGQLQRSLDEGRKWEIITDSPDNIITLTTNNASKDTVYAGTVDGLYISHNKGQSWSKVGSLNGAVTALVVSPTSDKDLLVYTQQQGLMSSSDGGTNWSKLDNYKGALVLHLASDPKNDSTLYLINQNLEIYKSTDKAVTWSKDR